MTAAAIAVNGRFRHLEPGGYRRYAEEISSRLHDAELLVPPANHAVGFRGRTWEQSVLARRAGKQVLFSPAASGPVRHPRHVVVVHDLLQLEHPDWFDPRVATVQARYLPLLLQRVRRVIVPSLDVARRVGEWFPHLGHRVRIVPPAVGAPFDRTPDPRRLAAMHRRLHLTDGRPLVVGLVAASTRKNPAALLEVLAEVRRRVGARVAVAGHTDRPRVVAGPPRPNHGSVTDLGALDDDDLAALLHLADVFVSLSRGEGYGMPIVEAAASGTAIVSTSVPAATETLAGRCRLVSADDRRGTVAAVIDELRRDTPARADERAALVRRWTWDDASHTIRHELEELNTAC